VKSGGVVAGGFFPSLAAPRLIGLGLGVGWLLWHRTSHRVPLPHFLFIELRDGAHQPVERLDTPDQGMIKALTWSLDRVRRRSTNRPHTDKKNLMDVSLEANSRREKLSGKQSATFFFVLGGRFDRRKRLLHGVDLAVYRTRFYHRI
jgi:hypothetical protein